MKRNLLRALGVAGCILVLSSCDRYLDEDVQFAVNNKACFPIELYFIDRRGTAFIGTIPSKGTASFDVELLLKYVKGGTQPTRVIMEAKAVGFAASATRELWVTEQDVQIGLLPAINFEAHHFGQSCF